MQDLKYLFKKYNIHPTKLRGQNFLISENVLQKIVDAAELTPDDTVLEIGPGLGMLTEALLERAGRVIAVETDKKLTEILRERFGERKNLEIIHGDILKFDIDPHLDPPSLRGGGGRWRNYKLVANIPYNITSEIITKFLSNESRPEMLVLMVQKEVADRILERDKKSSRLSIFVQYFGEPDLITRVPRGAFYPQPKVDSSVIKIQTHAGKYAGNAEREKQFFNMVKQGFAAPRKKLISNLRGLASKETLEKIFQQLNIRTNVRAENLGLLDWQRLYEAITHP